MAKEKPKPQLPGKKRPRNERNERNESLATVHIGYVQNPEAAGLFALYLEIGDFPLEPITELAHMVEKAVFEWVARYKVVAEIHHVDESGKELMKQ